MRLPKLRLSRRAIILIAVGASLVGLVIGGLLAYPSIGRWAIRSKVVPKLERKLGRNVTIGSIDVGFGHATLHDVEIRGERDTRAPLVHVDRVEVDFDFWPSLVGSVNVNDVVVDGVQVAAHRDAAGLDNFSDIAERLRAKPASGADSGGGSGLHPKAVHVHHVRADFTDDGAGLTAKIADGDAEMADGAASRLVLRGLGASLSAGPSAGADQVDAVSDKGVRTVKVAGGRVSLWPKLALTGIAGTVGDAGSPGRYQVELAGGYGDVDGQLWTAKGWVEPQAQTASIALDADRFTLDRLRPILENGGSIVDYGKTSIDASMRIDVEGMIAKFSGGFHLRDLTINNPKIADRPVPDLEMSGDVAGSFDRRARALTLDRGEFVSRGLPFEITGHAFLPGGLLADGSRREKKALDAHFVVPPVGCQQALEAIPPEIVPYLSGFELRGTFSADMHLAIDWANLEATQFADPKADSFGIRNCRVKHAPDDAGAKLKDSFEHWVELDEGEWTSFIIGPENPDFVPIDQISPYLRNSIMSTEDSNFYFHHGFIISEFRSALIKDLEANDFKFGASSITMQMVKNVLLFKEKTVARKLQELFLTWYVETILPKDRIYEIYLNAIEYGPGLYGIGPAARHYFGKSAHDLDPREAAFFSSILPNPKQRYEQYCKGELANWTIGKLDRILKTMLDRNRLTPEEYDAAMNTPLVFVKDGSESTDDCMRRTIRAIKKARPTSARPR
ncbi:MAG TPA: transglycosylase domain-containing protein [Kofleriaceae bacterium]|nr:transglycosylase domain-containing protein [Kofleriaceae bacterium]